MSKGINSRKVAVIGTGFVPLSQPPCAVSLSVRRERDLKLTR